MVQVDFISSQYKNNHFLPSTLGFFFHREKQLAAEKAEKERQELERKREREAQLKKEMEKLKEQVL